MDDPGCRTDLVQKAILSHLGNCCDWEREEDQRRAQNHPGNRGLTPREIKKILKEHVARGGKIKCKKETRENWVSKREFVYWVVAEVEDIPRGLFIELELAIEEPDYPVVSIVNAHPSSF